MLITTGNTMTAPCGENQNTYSAEALSYDVYGQFSSDKFTSVEVNSVQLRSVQFNFYFSSDHFNWDPGQHS